MSYEVKKLDKSQLELTFTVTPAEYQKDIEGAAVRLSERAAIKGFRPGKAPYEIVKQQVGELKILEEAAEKIVQRLYFEAIKTEKAAAIGMPQIHVEKLAPGNDFVFTATVALLPNVKLPDLKTISVKSELKVAGDKDVDEALGHIQKMQPKEEPKDGPATKDDKMTIDMQMFLDRVPVEGGQAKNHQVYLSEAHYIPGLAEQLVGLKKADTKEFSLPFPKEHYQKHLAGKVIDFKISVNDVYSLTYATLDDEFAKTLGQESLAKLKELLLANISRENEEREKRRFEEALLEQIIEKSKFDELPTLLVDSEKKKMFFELKHDLQRRGIEMDKYLSDIKKSEEQIYKDFAEGADKRARAALVSRQVAVENNISVSKEELEKEIAEIKLAYPGDVNVEENLKRPEVLETVASTVQNRKVVDFLRAAVSKK
ncbi:MAG: trigger factor [Patescibacteria group bacterium]|jgi:trigger factor